MLVLSEICISSTETIGGIWSGFLAINGKEIAAKKITNKWNPEEIKRLLYTTYLSLYGSDIKATLVNPEPESIPIISKTLP